MCVGGDWTVSHGWYATVVNRGGEMSCVVFFFSVEGGERKKKVGTRENFDSGRRCFFVSC